LRLATRAVRTIVRALTVGPQLALSSALGRMRTGRIVRGCGARRGRGQPGPAGAPSVRTWRESISADRLLQRPSTDH
jgi:hypothetical protein